MRFKLIFSLKFKTYRDYSHAFRGKTIPFRSHSSKPCSISILPRLALSGHWIVISEFIEAFTPTSIGAAASAPPPESNPYVFHPTLPPASSASLMLLMPLCEELKEELKFSLMLVASKYSGSREVCKNVIGTAANDGF
ncbi:unnamed protein product [Citrullus colocynthis]|uniref:Uncharacterized protein n=1 Tax=Citrullus colocynthis TaxID=252529 RepID=A0ABP0Z070_9ROSI